MAKRPNITYPRRGEIHLVRFDPAEGAEIKKTRPAVILQNDISNRFSPVTIVAAITSRFKIPLYPVQVLIHAPEGGLEVDSVIALNQIRTCDRSRIVKRLGKLKPTTMALIDQALRISLGLIDI